MNRRIFLGAAAGVALLPGCRRPPFNPCERLRPELAGHALVRAAWEGLDPTRVWDAHVHLLGVTDAAGGPWLHPDFDAPWRPLDLARKAFFLNAGCADGLPAAAVNAAYLERLRQAVREWARSAGAEGVTGAPAAGAPAILPAGTPAARGGGPKALLFAFDAAHDGRGRPAPAATAFVIPDAYAAGAARAAPDCFAWAASVHPYRGDAVEALDWAAAAGARAVKWLPAAMAIDPAAPRCDGFYEALARHGLPLITHAGRERALRGGDRQDFGNPLRLRRPLDRGVRVVVAHCASMGEDRDLDRGAHGPVRASFALFARLMDEPRHAGRLFGDVSALPQAARAAWLPQILAREDWHARLLNGSDYPLPGVLPLFSLRRLAGLGLLDAAAVPVLDGLRRANPLLFDFVLKRSLRWRGRGFPPGVFETAGFFAP